MNQILDYNPIRNGDGDNYRGNNSSKNNLLKAFSIILIVFAIILISIGILNRIINSKNNENKPQNVEARIETIQEGNSLKIIVDHENEITKLVYNWNTNPEKTISADNQKTFETTIDIPAGENTLNIQVVDIKGYKTFSTKTIISEDGIDIIDPIIKCERTEEQKVRILVTDENALSFITYRWNDEEETTVEVDEEDPKKIEIIIDAMSGTNNLTITAVDENNNNASLQQVFTGLMIPTIEVVLNEDKSKLLITCKHENGISKIEYTLNDKPYLAELTEAPSEVSFEQQLERGNNIIILNVTSVDGTTSNFAGQCTYEPDTSNVVIE